MEQPELGFRGRLAPHRQASCPQHTALVGGCYPGARCPLRVQLLLCATQSEDGLALRRAAARHVLQTLQGAARPTPLATRTGPLVPLGPLLWCCSRTWSVNP